MRRRLDANLVFAALFLAVCAAPLAAMLVPGTAPSGSLNEKRELAPLPVIPGTPVAALPSAWEAWFNDHFGLRGPLVRLQGLTRYRIFNESSSPLVLPGSDGWLFYDGRGVRGGDPRRNHLADLPEGYAGMFRELKEQFEHNDRYFAAMGMTYVFVVVPDKWSVYREQLPPTVGAPPELTSADRFLAYLRAETDLKILDLKSVLRERRWQPGPLYHQIDSHWNELGAYTAAGEIARFLAQFDPRVQPLAPAPEGLTWQRRTHGDLADLLGLGGWLSEQEPRLATTGLVPLEISELPPPRNAPTSVRFPINTRTGRPELPRMLVLRDSYGDALLPWLSRSFDEVRWMWTSNVRHSGIAGALDEVRPQFVIEEKAEKYLMFPIRYFTAPGRSAVVGPGSRGGKDAD